MPFPCSWSSTFAFSIKSKKIRPEGIQTEVFEIADSANTPEEGVQSLAAAFPEAETQYIADLFHQRAAAQSKREERYKLEGDAAKAVGNFL